MATTVAAAYFLLTADYGSEPNVFDPFIGVGSMVSPTILARRSLSYLMSDKPQEALNDAMQAQAADLSALGMDSEAQAAVKEGTVLESKRSKAAGQK
ncbi:unnamed protein product [Malus baccata var. baccata]